jgi:hypothetical protein
MTKRDCEEMFDLIVRLDSASYSSATNLTFAQAVARSARRLLREERERRESPRLGVNPLTPEDARVLLEQTLRTHPPIEEIPSP